MKRNTHKDAQAEFGVDVRLYTAIGQRCTRGVIRMAVSGLLADKSSEPRWGSTCALFTFWGPAYSKAERELEQIDLLALARRLRIGVDRNYFDTVPGDESVTTVRAGAIQKL